MKERSAEHDPRVYSRLRRRTALAGAIAFIIPFGLFYFLADYASERYVRKQVYARLEAGVASNTRLLDDVFDVRVAETRSLAQVLSRDAATLAQLRASLRGLTAGNPWYRLVLVAETSGEIVASSPEVRGSVADWEAFRAAREGQFGLSNAFFATLTQKPEMVVTAPLPRKGESAPWVLVAALDFEKLKSRLLDLAIGASEEEFIVNQAGQFISPPRFGGRVLADTAFDLHQKNPFQGAAGTAEYRNFRGQVVLSAYRKLAGKDCYMVAQVTRDEITGIVRQLRREILSYVAPFLILGVILALVAWHYAMAYIRKLMSELYEALGVARQRERERDLAHKELAKRFEEERELARQKAQFQTQLAEYEKYAALAQLALGAAHEINNPLLGILSHLELEMRAAKSDEQRAEIQQCIEGTKRISSTVRGLLNYARPVPLLLSKISLDQLVSDTFAFLCHQPLFRNKTLEKKIPLDLAPISADANQISQVLMNLLLNAAEATPDGGTITVSAEKVKFEDKVEIRVTDTGSGIDPDILPHVLEPFFTTKRGKGTGLGLSITEAYIRSHGGDIKVESIPQHGTTVRFTLPIRQEGRPVPESRDVVT